jgi:hypothetical protein
MIGAVLWILAQSTPGASWETRTPEETGMIRSKLEALRDLAGGRGCVVRKGVVVFTWGDVAQKAGVAEASRPVVSLLMLLAVQGGLLRGMDDPVLAVEPGLLGKDRSMTWRHLASQTSGFGCREAPGEAYGETEGAQALYARSLFRGVYGKHGTEVLKKALGDPLGFEDAPEFAGSGPEGGPGSLAISVRDFARVGVFVLRGGAWKGRQLMDAPLLYLSISTPVPPETPLASGREDGPGAGGPPPVRASLGPGLTSFGWWVNRSDAGGRMLYPDVPGDTVVASGDGGKRALWIIPGLDLVASWNDATIGDLDRSAGNRDSLNNRAGRILAESVR